MSYDHKVCVMCKHWLGMRVSKHMCACVGWLPSWMTDWVTEWLSSWLAGWVPQWVDNQWYRCLQFVFDCGLWKCNNFLLFMRSYLGNLQTHTGIYVYEYIHIKAVTNINLCLPAFLLCNLYFCVSSLMCECRKRQLYYSNTRSYIHMYIPA